MMSVKMYSFDALHDVSDVMSEVTLIIAAEAAVAATDNISDVINVFFILN